MAGRMRGDEGRDFEADVVGTNLDPRMAAWKGQRKEKRVRMMRQFLLQPR